MTRRKRSIVRRLLLAAGSLILALPLSFLVYFFVSPNPCLLKERAPESSAFMELRKEEAQRQGRTLRIHYYWTPLKKIPEVLVAAVLSSEDDRFFDHHGIDWREMRRALIGGSRGKTLRGASTISQQLVKNLYLSPKRSLFRKLKEFILTIKLELCLDKKRILECYLNVIELGNGVFGVEAASRRFFSKSVSDLSFGEMIRLASVIPKPLKVSPLSESKYIRWRMQWIARRLLRKRVINDAQYHEILRASP